MAKGLLGLTRPLGLVPIKAMMEDKRRTCKEKEGDMISSFTFNLDLPRRADTLDVSVGELAGPGAGVTQAFTVPTKVTLIGMVRRESEQFEISSGATESLTTDKNLLVRKAKIEVIPENRGFKSVELCVE